MALGAVFGFAVLARTGELLTLLRGQVHFDVNMVIVNFSGTKRGQRLGIDEGQVVRDPITAKVLRLLCQGLSPGDALLGCSERELRAAWAMAARVLRLQHLSLRPYSLRRGGATHLFRRTGNLHAVAQAGRWSSLQTTRRYISDATAALTSLELTDWQRFWPRSSKPGSMPSLDDDDDATDDRAAAVVSKGCRCTAVCRAPREARI